MTVSTCARQHRAISHAKSISKNVARFRGNSVIQTDFMNSLVTTVTTEKLIRVLRRDAYEHKPRIVAYSIRRKSRIIQSEDSPIACAKPTNVRRSLPFRQPASVPLGTINHDILNTHVNCPFTTYTTNRTTTARNFCCTERHRF